MVIAQLCAMCLYFLIADNLSMFHVHSDFLFDCYMRYTNTLMYVCMYVA